MTLKERMTNELKKLYSNLGLPETMLNSVVDMAIIGLEEGAEDSVIESRAKEKYISDALKSFQSTLDKTRTDAQRAAEEKRNKGEKELDPNEKPSWLQEILDAQKQTTDALKSEIESLKAADETRKRDELIQRVATELGLNSDQLDLVKPGLSSDMDETAIRTKLGAAKKLFIDTNADGTEYSPNHRTEADEAMRQEAEAWVKAQAEK